MLRKVLSKKFNFTKANISPSDLCIRDYRLTAEKIPVADFVQIEWEGPNSSSCQHQLRIFRPLLCDGDRRHRRSGSMVL
jgi:hypothetical protein